MIDATRDDEARGREYVRAWNAIPDPRFARRPDDEAAAAASERESAEAIRRAAPRVMRQG